MKNSQAKLSRRHFLLATAAGGATATVALVAGKKTDPITEPQATTAGKAQGYRLTEHIRNYYRTAKV